MKEVYKTLAVLVCWSIAAVAYANDECMHGDIRLREKAVGNTEAGTGGLEVCVNSSWTTVCNTGGWHSTSLNGISENTRVACRQLGYREEGATFTYTSGNEGGGPPKTETGLRQGNCSGSEPRLIACPDLGNYGRCSVGVKLICQLATCDTTIRLRSGRTATEGRVEVYRDGQWGTVCDDSWDRNDASVACRQLGLSNFNAVAVPTTHFGAGSGEIHLSNLQCTGSEAALTDCTSDTTHQCSHNRDAGVICLPFNTSIDIVHTDVPECANGTIRVVYDSEAKEVQLCSNQTWNMCNSICQNGVMQLGAYFCGSGEITHFLMSGSQLYECPISRAGKLFLICELTTQTSATLANSCQQVLQDIELQATSSSIAVTWGNTEDAQSFNNSSAEYEITCSPEGSDLRHSIAVELTTSEVTIENLPHSTTYECCVTLHIGRYSTRACSNTATLSDNIPSTSTTQTPCGSQNDSTAIQGAGLWADIALDVLVAALVLLLVLATGAWLCSRNRLPQKTNPAYGVRKSYPQQTTADSTYETVDL